ncbi:MAG: hypothetical protein WDO68_11005 [Gammaproteobacteria bacterium]
MRFLTEERGARWRSIATAWVEYYKVKLPKFVARAWSIPDAVAILDEVASAAVTFAATARKLKVRGGPALKTVLADVQRRTGLLA